MKLSRRNFQLTSLLPSNTIVLDGVESHWYGICNKLDERQQFQELTRRA